MKIGLHSSKLVQFVFILFCFFQTSNLFSQVTTLQDWSNLYNATGSGTTTAYTVPAGSGSNRVLVVAIASSQSAVGARTVSITYGGQTMTLADGNMGATGIRQHTAVYYLNEAGLDAASDSNLIYSITGGTTRATTVWAAVFDYVDQSTPLTNSRNYDSGTTQVGTFAFGTALTINANDQAIYVLSSVRSGNATQRSINTLPANFTNVNQQDVDNSDGIRNAIIVRTVPTSNTSSTCSTVMSGNSLGSMTGISLKGCVLATANAGSALTAICQGGTSAGLGGSVGGSATGGTWSSSVAGGTFTPDATTLNATWTPPTAFSGTATLTLTTSGGSCGIATASKSLVVNPSPTSVIATVGDPTICSGNSTTLTTSFSYPSSTATDSASPSASIPDVDLVTGVTSQITLPSTCASANEISSVTLDISHTWNADLDIYLISPNGTQVTLCTDRGGSGDNITATLQTGGTTLPTGNTTINGTFAPQSPFSDFTGGATGIWTLRVFDDAADDFGIVNSWSITVNSATCGLMTYSWSPATGLSSSTVQNPTASPTATTNYEVTVTPPTGCAATSSPVSVTVNPIPTASVISGTATICLGSSANLQVTITGGTSPFDVVYSAGSLSSYTSGSNIAVSPTSTTTYTLTSVTDANGCVGTGNSGSAIVTIDVTTTTDGGASWSNGSPSATKSVLFDGSSATLSADLTACSLRLTNNATVVVNSGFDVILNGRLTVDSGSTFTLNNNANLLQNNILTNVGSITVNRNSSLLKRLDYTLWSSPVAAQNLLSFSPQTVTNRFYTYDSTTNLYVAVADPSVTNFTAANGYLIRVPNNHTTSFASIWAGQFAGVPHNGNYTITMQDDVSGQRFNLVGNPYPSPIDAVAFVDETTNSSSITGTLYFWRKTNNTASPSYCTWSTAGFVTNSEAQVFDPNDVIQVGQGFFVEATGTDDQLVFNNDMRIDNHANQFFRTNQTTNSIERNRVWLNASNADGAFSQAMIGYMTNATNGFDARIDGKFINDGEIAFASLLDATPMAIQGRMLPFDVADEVPMRFRATTAGNYTIAIDHVDGLFSNGQTVFLKDNLLGTEHNLSEGAYAFATDAGTFDNRFAVVYQSTLDTNNPTLTPNQVIVYPNDASALVITTGTLPMQSVKVFDIRGRLLAERQNINATQTTIAVNLTNEVVLVQITSETGMVVTKKVVK